MNKNWKAETRNRKPAHEKPFVEYFLLPAKLSFQEKNRILQFLDADKKTGGTQHITERSKESYHLAVQWENDIRTKQSETERNNITTPLLQTISPPKINFPSGYKAWASQRIIWSCSGRFLPKEAR